MIKYFIRIITKISLIVIIIKTRLKRIIFFIIIKKSLIVIIKEVLKIRLFSII